MSSRVLVAALLVLASSTISLHARRTISGIPANDTSDDLFIIRKPAVDGLPGDTDVILDIPPRYMWGWGAGLNGYCGETSFQSHGIFFGNWISSEHVRYAGDRKELLIGVTDVKTAQNLKFTYTAWDYNQKTPQGSNFFKFAKTAIDAGNIVVAGFYEKMPSGEGDDDYDHIMPIVGYRVSTTGSVTGIHYNDLYGTTASRFLPSSSITSRSGCTQSAQPQQPFSYCLPSSYDYGIQLKGIVDTTGATFRTLLKVPKDREPDWGQEDKKHESVVPFTITAVVAGLTSGQSYSILRFDGASSLPTSNFLSGSYTDRFDFTATASKMVFEGFDTIMSDSQTFYRTVASP